MGTVWRYSHTECAVLGKYGFNVPTLPKWIPQSSVTERCPQTQQSAITAPPPPKPYGSDPAIFHKSQSVKDFEAAAERQRKEHNVQDCLNCLDGRRSDKKCTSNKCEVCGATGKVMPCWAKSGNHSESCVTVQRDHLVEIQVAPPAAPPPTLACHG